MSIVVPFDVYYCFVQCSLWFRPMSIASLSDVCHRFVQCSSSFRLMSITIPFEVYCRSIRHPSSFHSTSIVVPFDVYWRFVRRLFVRFCSSSPFHPLMFIYCRSSPSTHPHSSNRMYVIHTYLISYSSNHMLC